MKLPALRGKIGNREYYITNLTFQQVNDHVAKIDDELHQSKGLKDLIQRSITSNFKSIKDYILNQPDLFFNSIILAVYDDYPNWVEIEITYENLETYQVGLLDFPSEHKIFPVDGQHRVEGIKAALKAKPELCDVKIPAIFIGHTNDGEGMKKTRRLFTTLNRYAKPVTMDDIIALDEDDTVAIVTRMILENIDLFKGNRVVYSKQKALPKTNIDALTSIITLYQCNLEIFKYYFFQEEKTDPTPKRIGEYLKFRKSDQKINKFYNYCSKYWDILENGIDQIKEYKKINKDAAKKFRNANGGNILFRPIGLLPFVKATIKIKFRKETKLKQVIEHFNTINLDINDKPWHFVIWNPIGKNMIMNNTSLTEKIFIYKYDSSLLKPKELEGLIKSYAAKISFEDEDLSKVLTKL